MVFVGTVGALEDGSAEDGAVVGGSDVGADVGRAKVVGGAFLTSEGGLVAFT